MQTHIEINIEKCSKIKSPIHMDCEKYIARTGGG